MCDICGQHPCNSRCPNADDGTPVLVCSDCGTEIYEEEEYYHIDGKNMCEECFEEYAKMRYRHTAERDNLFDDDDFWED